MIALLLVWGYKQKCKFNIIIIQIYIQIRDSISDSKTGCSGKVVSLQTQLQKSAQIFFLSPCIKNIESVNSGHFYINILTDELFGLVC